MSGQARAAILLKNLEDLFPIAKSIKKRRDGADIERMRSQPEHVAGQPIQLGENYADVFRARRSFNVQQFFNGLAIT